MKIERFSKDSFDKLFASFILHVLLHVAKILVF